MYNFSDLMNKNAGSFGGLLNGSFNQIQSNPNSLVNPNGSGFADLVKKLQALMGGSLYSQAGGATPGFGTQPQFQRTSNNTPFTRPARPAVMPNMWGQGVFTNPQIQLPMNGGGGSTSPVMQVLQQMQQTQRPQRTAASARGGFFQPRY